MSPRPLSPREHRAEVAKRHRIPGSEGYVPLRSPHRTAPEPNQASADKRATGAPGRQQTGERRRCGRLCGARTYERPTGRTPPDRPDHHRYAARPEHYEEGRWRCLMPARRRCGPERQRAPATLNPRKSTERTSRSDAFRNKRSEQVKPSVAAKPCSRPHGRSRRRGRNGCSGDSRGVWPYAGREGQADFAARNHHQRKTRTAWFAARPLRRAGL
jgi:hypothetical protein